MRFSILRYGTQELPNRLLMAGGDDNRVAAPVWGAVFQTEGHNILYDLGCMENCMEKWPKELRDACPYQEGDKSIDQLLAQISLRCSDIDIVVVSHLHPDHFGLIPRFTHADVYVGEEEWIQAMKEVFGKYENRIYPQGNYYYDCMSAPVKEYHFIRKGEEFELFKGLRILSLPGHAPNVLGLLVTTDSGSKYIFCSDAVYTPANLGPPEVLPGVVFNTEELRSTFRRIRALSQAEDAVIMFSHYAPFFDTLKQAPAWYE